MRKVKYGLFQDMIVEFDPMEYDHAMIGANIATNNMAKEYAKTRSPEYYIVDEENSIVRINDPSILEKMIARADYLISKNKRQVMSRAKSKTNWDNNDEKLKDLSNPQRLYETYEDDKKTIRKKQEELDKMLEDKKEDTNETQKRI